MKIVGSDTPEPDAPEDEIDFNQPGALAKRSILPARLQQTPEERAYETEKARLTARERLADEHAAEKYKPFSFGKTLKEWQQEGIPPVDWLIQDWIEVGENVIIQGDAKAAKSTTAGEIVRCLATGHPLFGSYKVKQWVGRIAYIDAEMGIRTHVRKLSNLYLTEKEMERIEPVSLVEYDFDIMSKYAYENLVTQLKDRNIKILVFDPLMHITDFENENDNALAARVVRRLNLLKVEAELDVIILVAHTPDGTGTRVGAPIKVRGASQWKGWASHYINCYYDEDADKYYLKKAPSRERPEDEQVLKARLVSLGVQGELTLSVPAPATTKVTSTSTGSSTFRDAVLKFLMVSPGCSSNKLFEYLSSSEHVADKVAYRTAMGKMKEEGLVVFYPPPGKGRSGRIYRTEDDPGS